MNRKYYFIRCLLGLHSRTDDAFLLRFLRARKFDYERALNLIISYYRAQVDNKDMLGQLVPSSVKHILDAGVAGVLPHRDKEGRKVMVIRPGEKMNEALVNLRD